MQFMMVGFTRADNPNPAAAQSSLAGARPHLPSHCTVVRSAPRAALLAGLAQLLVMPLTSDLSVSTNPHTTMGLSIDSMVLCTAGYTPDSTTVFTRKGDLLQLGELVLPADAQLKVNQSQASPWILPKWHGFVLWLFYGSFFEPLARLSAATVLSPWLISNVIAQWQVAVNL